MRPEAAAVGRLTGPGTPRLGVRGLTDSFVRPRW